MKKYWLWWFGIACMVLGAMVSAGPSTEASKQTLVLSMPEEAEVHFKQATKPIAYRRFLRAANSLGLEVELVFQPGLRSMAMANTGKVDGLFGRPVTIESTYGRLVRVNEPIKYSRPGVYGFKKLNWKTADLKRLVALRGSASFYQAFAGFNEKYELIKINSIEQALQLLRVGRAEAIITAAVQMDYYRHVNKGLTEGLLHLGPELEAEPVYTYLHESHSDLADKLAKALREVPETLDE